MLHNSQAVRGSGDLRASSKRRNNARYRTVGLINGIVSCNATVCSHCIRFGSSWLGRKPRMRVYTPTQRRRTLFLNPFLPTTFDCNEESGHHHHHGGRVLCCGVVYTSLLLSIFTNHELWPTHCWRTACQIVFGEEYVLLTLTLTSHFILGHPRAFEGLSRLCSFLFYYPWLFVVVLILIVRFYNPGPGNPSTPTKYTLKLNRSDPIRSFFGDVGMVHAKQGMMLESPLTHGMVG